MSDICLCMIVNNEEHVIERCLNSVFQHIKFWVINDNGSTDKTPEIITNFFKQKGIPGILNKDGWKGFSHNRSLVFEIAEKESNCDWMYVIDADDYLETPLMIPDNPPNADSFIINLQEGPNVMQTRQQLFRVGRGWGYAGAVHEYPFSKKFESKKLKIGKTTQITVRASRGGARNQDPLKYWKDARAMEKDIERVRSIPKDQLPHWEKNLEARYCYYICQSWHDFGRYDYAIKWAEERVKYAGFKEEIYRAYLLRARCMRRLQYPQEQIVEAIGGCINYDKFRAEGYFEMAHQYVQHEQWEDAWKWIKPTIKMKRPTDKLFIVEDFTYDFGAKKEACWVAHKLGHYFDSYKIANDLCETYTLDKRHRSWAYNIKHKNVPHLLESTTQYSDDFKNIKNKVDNKVVVNFEPCSDNEVNIKSLSSFINCTKDYIKIDQWYYSPFPGDEELLKKFPFLQSGYDGLGDLTINLYSRFYFFHRCDLITELKSFVIESLKEDNAWAKKQLEKAIKKKNKKQIEKFKKILEKEELANKNIDNGVVGVCPKIVYFNRYGKEELISDEELPDLFDTAASTVRKQEQQKLVEQSKVAAQSQQGKRKLQKRVKIMEYDENDYNQKLVKMDNVVRSPHVVFKQGEGLWSLERVSCVSS